MLGREVQTVVNEFQGAAAYSVNIDASGLASGIHFYRLQVGSEFVAAKKMLFLK